MLEWGQEVSYVDRRAAVALEAMEGTDELVRRAGRIAGPGTTVVKVAKPRQERRFDVAVVGVGTVEALVEARAAVLAVETGKTLLIDSETFLARAGEALELLSSRKSTGKVVLTTGAG